MAGTEFASEPDRARDIHPAGRTQRQTLVLRQVEDDRQGLGVLDAERVVEEVLGNDIEINAQGLEAWLERLRKGSA